MVDLNGNAAFGQVHRLAQLVQAGDKPVMIEPQLRRAVGAGRRVDACVLHDDEPDASAGALRVVFDMLEAHLAAQFAEVAPHRAHDDAIFSVISPIVRGSKICG